jgi:hypothetical protein
MHIGIFCKHIYFIMTNGCPSILSIEGRIQISFLAGLRSEIWEI